MKNDAVMIDDDPLVFFHFASTQIDPDGKVHILVSHRGGRSKAVLFEHVIEPYARRLEEENRSLHERFPVLITAVSNIRYPSPQIQAT
jgi:hypothetical protein